MSIDPTQQQKDVEFYAAGVAAWFNTALEHDKSIFGLSAGGIGLLVTLLTTIGIDNVVLVVLYIVAICAFLASLVAVLAIFRRNRTHIEQVFRGSQTLDPVLTVLDQVAIASFGAGAILTAVIGVSTAVAAYTAKEKTVATNAKPIVSSEPLTKSFNGLGNLQSTASSPAPAPAATPAPSPAPAPATSSNTNATNSK